MNQFRKPELLAPAGSYEGFLGAIQAGADAVYLGGEKFGARAYAGNFTKDEVCRAIRYAHLWGKKVYLTVNTLMKQSEMAELYEYLLPFYECGLDAVIVQDFGVLKLVRECLPQMDLHISTQMTVTGVRGAGLMKQWGASRVVPARELSLAEVQAIREQAGIEVETFIHGALCYSYSGQCLFSSVLGGRSGNRGRCAQPCRLPYGREQNYPLSLRDLCTIEMLPSLIGAGIDSFKIEGRMKKPEYAAGVTAVYRKYIDRYLAAPKEEYRVEKADLTCLKQLYLRSGLSDGYYTRHNGREMITLDQPGYAGSREELLAEIREKYGKEPDKLPADGRLRLVKKEEAELTVKACGQTVQVCGVQVQQARKQPLDHLSVERQLQKTGNTPFCFRSLSVEMDPDIFLPVKALNELRREAFSRLFDRIAGPALPRSADRPPAMQQPLRREDRPLLAVSAMTLKQALTLLALPETEILYLPADCLMADADAENGYRSHHIDEQKLECWKKAIRRKRQNTPGFVSCLSLPVILRSKEEAYFRALLALVQEEEADQILTGSLEGYAWLLERKMEKPLVLDANLYLWNEEAAALLEAQERAAGRESRFTLPLEGSRQQLRSLAAGNRELVVYGRVPMMVSANCIRKTCGECLLTARKTAEQAGMTELTDRYRKNFPVHTNCRHCYNIIYNSVPGALHRELTQIAQWGLGAVRLQFTTEDDGQLTDVVRTFAGLLCGQLQEASLSFETTRGHFKNGVE